MMHLTMTGPCAGTPFCGVSRLQATFLGDEFMHIPYSGTAWMDREDLCPICLRMYCEAGDYDPEDDKQAGLW